MSSRKFECPRCRKFITSRDGDHLRSHGLVLAGWRCPHCTYSRPSDRSNDVSKHRERMHEGAVKMDLVPIFDEPEKPCSTTSLRPESRGRRPNRDVRKRTTQSPLRRSPRKRSRTSSPARTPSRSHSPPPRSPSPRASQQAPGASVAAAKGGEVIDLFIGPETEAEFSEGEMARSSPRKLAKELIRRVKPLSPLHEDDQPGPSSSEPVAAEPAYTMEGVTGFIQGLSLQEWEDLRASRPTEVKSQSVQVRARTSSAASQTVAVGATSLRTSDGGLHVELPDGSAVTVRGPLTLPTEGKKK